MNIKWIFTVLMISMFAQAQSLEAIAPADQATTSTTSAAPETKTSGNGIVVRDDPDYFSKSSFGMAFYSLGGYDDSQFRNADPSFAVYDSYFSFSWKMPNDIRLALLPTFGYNTSGNDYVGRQVTDKFYWRDFSLSVAQNRLLENYLSASWSLKQKARLYLPTSDGSKEEGMIARLRLEVEARYNLDRYSSIRMYLKPSYYFQRSKSYLTTDGRSIRSSKMIDSEHGAEVNWNLNKLFSIKPGFEIGEKWANRSDTNAADMKFYRNGALVDGNGNHVTEIDYRLGFEIRPTRNMNFTFGIQETRDLIDPSVQPVVGYSLLTNITLL